MEDLSMYNPEGSDLRKMQMRMLDMLIFVDSVCEKHNIKYWLAFGTLLGAVRHGGFIPWDDDLDIEMLKDDYDILLSLIDKELPNYYHIQNHKSDRNYIFPIAKLRDKNSRITENKNADKNYKMRGIYIDLFYLDKGNKFIARLTVNIQKILFATTLLKNDKLGILALLRNFLYFKIHKIVFPLIRILVKLFGIKSYIAPYGTGFASKRKIEEILPLKKILFEGKYFNSPHNTDTYLKDIYGNYMELPADDERRVHTLELIFEEKHKRTFSIFGIINSIL